ncbi:hypothetical protein [Citrobacter portucalensis]|uniref:hypothetical protein n=1 Tax=Citrobacter portucalensis TaxID=1639133 RepID=UPI003F1CE90C
MLGSLLQASSLRLVGGAAGRAMMLPGRKLKEQELTGEDGPNIVDNPARQTTVIFNVASRVKSVPLGAMKQGINSADEFREVEGEIVLWFLCHSKPELIKPTVGRDRYVRWSVNVNRPL